MGSVFMINFYNLDFTNKTILEVGTGRGGTTLELARILQNFKGTKLITTDIYDGNFKRVQDELKGCSLDIDFIKTDGCELNGIEKNSIDILVCNYTLCAINAKSGSEIIALNKFKEILKSDGILYIEEEYPLNIVENKMQQVWARKWQLLRAANMLLGELPYNEINPEILEKILHSQGFKNIQWENETSQILGEDCLEFFNYRFNNILGNLENMSLVEGLKIEKEILEDYTRAAGGMEIPIYRIIATNE